MEPYSRALVRFAHVAVAARARVEAFTLGTRLTRLTRELTTRDPDDALARAAAAVPDWSGGTRLGDALRRFNDEWGVRGMARGAVVVILSDGWDRGDPDELAEQMARLRPGGPPDRLGEPAEGLAGLRAPRAWDGRGVTLRRRVRRGPLRSIPSRSWPASSPPTAPDRATREEVSR